VTAASGLHGWKLVAATAAMLAAVLPLAAAGSRAV
jgi:hypothetical protein